MLVVGALAVLTGVVGPVGAQEVFLDNCEERLFGELEGDPNGQVVGYSCKGVADNGTFEDECVCFSQELPVETTLSADFYQFQADSCPNNGEGAFGSFNACACQARGTHLRASNAYTCVPSVHTAAEGADPDATAFATNVGKVSLTGHYIWPGAGLIALEGQEAAYGCRRDAACTNQCASCFVATCGGGDGEGCEE